MKTLRHDNFGPRFATWNPCSSFLLRLFAYTSRWWILLVSFLSLFYFVKCAPELLEKRSRSRELRRKWGIFYKVNKQRQIENNGYRIIT